MVIDHSGATLRTEERSLKKRNQQKGIDQNASQTLQYITTSQCSVTNCPQQIDSAESNQAKGE